MNVAKTIRSTISQQGADTLWSFADFSHLSQVPVAKALSRLAKEGFIQRIRKGIYYFPKSTALGLSRPSASALLEKTLGRKGDAIFSGGTSSFQNLGVTTQVPAQYTLLAPGASRKVMVGNLKVTLRQRRFTNYADITQEDAWLLDAVRNIKHPPDSTPHDAALQVMKVLRARKRPLKKLLNIAMSEPPRVRAVLGAMAENIGYKGPEVGLLKKSLNRLTKFQTGFGKLFSNAASWGIV